MAIGKHLRELTFAALLLAGALALWLSAAQPGHAASAEQVQGTTVEVQGKAISWAANAACTEPTIGNTADFGTSPPGGGVVATGSFRACVLSNAPWSVTALGTDLTNGAESIPAANILLSAFGLNGAFDGPSDPTPASISEACSLICNMGSTQTVVSAASASPDTSGFRYLYQLNVPGSKPSGTYTGSVTFTASN